MTWINWPQRLRGLLGKTWSNSPRLSLATVRSRSMPPLRSENAEYRRRRVRIAAPDASDADGRLDGLDRRRRGLDGSASISSPRRGSSASKSWACQNGTCDSGREPTRVPAVVPAAVPALDVNLRRPGHRRLALETQEIGDGFLKLLSAGTRAPARDRRGRPGRPCEAVLSCSGSSHAS